MFNNWHSLTKPSQLQVDADTLTATYGKFCAEPFEKGFGTVLGNSLRRVLLSSIQGAAITSLRIKGVLHEFSAIQGVTEDVAEIILNLKAVRFKLHSTGQATVQIKCKGAGVISAGSIITGHNVDVMNPDKYIATCGNDANLDVEMTIKTGRGYVPAERNRVENAPVDTIAIDSIYTPIRKVNFATTTHTHAGQLTDYDTLCLEVWTDGSVTPEDAVAYAAKNLRGEFRMKFTGQRLACFVVAALLSVTTATLCNAGFNVNVDIGIPVEQVQTPPPPAQVELPPQPPQFVYVPDLGYYVAAGVAYDLLYVGRKYFYFNNGIWYQADHYGAPWVYTPVNRLPVLMTRHSYVEYRKHREAELVKHQHEKDYKGEFHRPEVRKEDKREEHRDERR